MFGPDKCGNDHKVSLFAASAVVALVTQESRPSTRNVISVDSEHEEIARTVRVINNRTAEKAWLVELQKWLIIFVSCRVLLQSKM